MDATSSTAQAGARRARCHPPYDPADRCPHGHGDQDESGIQLGVGELQGRDLLWTSRRRGGLTRVIRRATATRALPQALSRRVKVSYDSLDVYVTGTRADLISTARIAHRLAQDHATPVLNH